MTNAREMPTGNHSNEKIDKAALRYKGEIFSGVAHVFAFEELHKKYPDAEDKEVEHGFTTTSGNFVDRRTAMNMAKKQHQLRKGRDWKEGLTSEDTTHLY